MSDDGLNEFLKVAGTKFQDINHNAPRKESEAPITETESEQTQGKFQNSVWMTFQNKRVFKAAQGSVKKLPADTYDIGISHGEIFFRRLFINTDEIFEMPDTNSEKILHHIEKFWQRESVFRQYNFLWKRGILLFGPQGSGKTSLLNLVTKKAIKMDYTVIYVDTPGLAVEGLRIFREIEPTRNLVVILEDIDSIINNHGESDMLRLLDGENQVDNIVFIATTNYPENLNPRLINRPSRFDIVMKIDLPSEAARRYYLQRVNPKFHKLNSDILKADFEKWVSDTKGFSVAHLKDLIVSVEIMGAPYLDSVSRLKKMSKHLSSSDNVNNLGFITPEEKETSNFALDDNTEGNS